MEINNNSPSVHQRGRRSFGFIGSVGFNIAASEEEWWGGEFERAVEAVQKVALSLIHI